MEEKVTWAMVVLVVDLGFMVLGLKLALTHSKNFEQVNTEY